MNSIVPPGIRRITGRLFQGSDWLHFEQAVALGCQKITFDSGLKRPPEADYNPRPARLVELMILEAELEDLASLCSAALCDLSGQEIPDTFHIERQIVSDAQKPSEANSLTPRVEALALARLLDDVRHIHMRQDYSKDMNTQYTITIQNFMPQLKHAQSRKLGNKLEAWVNRFGHRK